MKSLRDRIAAAALNAYEGHAEAWKQSEGDIKRQDWLDLADAVLRELGLTPEFGCGTSDLRHGCRCSHRYVTEWETDASR